MREILSNEHACQMRQSISLFNVEYIHKVYVYGTNTSENAKLQRLLRKLVQPKLDQLDTLQLDTLQLAMAMEPSLKDIHYCYL